MVWPTSLRNVACGSISRQKRCFFKEIYYSGVGIFESKCDSCTLYLVELNDLWCTIFRQCDFLCKFGGITKKGYHFLTSNISTLTTILHFRSGSLSDYPESRKWSSQCSSSMASLYTHDALGFFFFSFFLQYNSHSIKKLRLIFRITMTLQHVNN